MEEAHPPPAVWQVEQPAQLLRQPLRGCPAEELGMRPDGLGGVPFHAEAQLEGKPGPPQEPHRVGCQGVGRDESHDTPAQVVPAARGVQDPGQALLPPRSQRDREGHGVDGVVPATQVLLDRPREAGDVHLHMGSHHPCQALEGDRGAPDGGSDLAGSLLGVPLHDDIDVVEGSP